LKRNLDGLWLNIWPLGNTAQQAIELSSARGKNKTPPRAKWMPPTAKNPGKNTLLPGTARLNAYMKMALKLN
jgi:hypothetical protein